jgi:tetratricopeptide (TPR) repeat protein
VVLVAFGNAAYYAAGGHAELAFQNDFWTAEESAETSFAKGDYVQAEEQLNKMKALLSSGTAHMQERWQWMTIMGRLRMSQQKYEEAGQYFKDALALRENKNEDKNSFDTAVSLGNLGALFAEEKRFDLAYENGSRALAIYQKNFKKAGNAAMQQSCGRAVANESRMLLKVAQERKDAAEVGKQCQVLKDFQAFLSAADRESVTSACHSSAK